MVGQNVRRRRSEHLKPDKVHAGQAGRNTTHGAKACPLQAFKSKPAPRCCPAGHLQSCPMHS
jgi:hypothetical protein